MGKVARKDDPALWERVKSEVTEGDKGGRAGQWSARKAQLATQEYKRRGGSYVGIHSAADTEHDWPLYGRLVGAWFKSHPIQQTADFVNEAPTHPATSHLAPRFNVFDEFYSFKSNPRPDVRVLLTIDESTYDPDPNTTHLPGNTPSSGVMGDHPMSWCHDNLGGRVFYTALGHENYLYELDWFRQHLLGGILTATKRIKATCKPPA
jgi:type 1 glutamine amidotransferase